MTNIFNDPSNNATIQAIEEAISNASDEICRKVDLKKFDPWEEGDPLTQSSHDFCGQFFDAEIAARKQRISKNQQASDLVSYAGTRGWLCGYFCAQDEANPVISNQANDITRLNQELVNIRNDLTQKTKEANKLKDELEKLESTDKGKLYQRLKFAKYCCGVLFIVAAVAIVIIIIN